MKNKKNQRNKYHGKRTHGKLQAMGEKQYFTNYLNNFTHRHNFVAKQLF